MLKDFGFYVDDSLWVIYLERERVCTSRKRGKSVLRVKSPLAPECQWLEYNGSWVEPQDELEVCPKMSIVIPPPLSHSLSLFTS